MRIADIEATSMGTSTKQSGFVSGVLLAAFLLLALSACQAGGTRPIIKIGLTAPFSGYDESLGYSVIGAVRLAVRERNQSGGVAGYSVELVALDDGNAPDQAAQRAREMIIDPAVMAVLGGFDTTAAAAAGALYAQDGMPFVTFATGDALGANALRLVGSEQEAGWLAGKRAALDKSVKRIAVISDRTAGADVLTEQFAAVAPTGGATSVYSGYIQRWQLDYTMVTRDVAIAAPDLVFFAGRAVEAGEILKQMRAAGVSATFLGGPGVDDPRLLQIAGEAAHGSTYVSLGFAMPQVEASATRDKIAQAGLRPSGAYTVLAYDGTRLILDALQQAIKAAGKPARAAVADALRASRFTGASGEIAFDTDGERRAAPVAVYQIKDNYPGALTLQ